MKTIILDLTGCKSLRDIHERIRIAFDFPDWYGKNWDAFWDLLRTECDANTVIIKGKQTIPKNTRPKNRFASLKNCARCCKMET